MSCNCNSSSSAGTDPVTNEPLPTITDQATLAAECEASSSTWVEPACPSGTIQSQSGQGTVLDSSLTDARCAQDGEGVTLLGRMENILAKFIGNGFLQIKDGKAYVVSWVPLTVRQLWHRYWKPGTSSFPILGDPHPFPYGVVASSTGDLYGIQGYAGKDSLHVWSHERKQWETISPDQFPQEVSRQIVQSFGIELTGYDPVPIDGAPENVRVLKALSGEGLVFLEKVPVPAAAVPPECEPCPDNGFAYVAKVLDFPVITPSETETGRHRLVFSSLGLYWEAE
jgi:hypothetical protein